MRTVVVAALLLLGLASGCQQPAQPAMAGTAASPGAASPAVVLSTPDTAYVAIGDSASDIFFLQGVKTARFAGPSATDPALSPDGKTVAYIEVDPGRRFRIKRSNLDGSAARVLVEGTDMLFTPCWSPDGRRLAFLRKGDGDFTLCTLDAEGGEPQVVAAKGPRGPLESMLAPCWAADGKRIYVSALDVAAPGIFSVDAASGQATLLGHGFQPQLSPDGQQLSYIDLVDGEPRLKIARPDLGAARTIEAAQPMAARWSRDGRRFFYNLVSPSGGYELWAADASGSGGARVGAAGNAILSSTAVMLPSILRALSRVAPSAAPSIRLK